MLCRGGGGYLQATDGVELVSIKQDVNRSESKRPITSVTAQAFSDRLS